MRPDVGTDLVDLLLAEGHSDTTEDFIGGTFHQGFVGCDPDFRVLVGVDENSEDWALLKQIGILMH